VAPFHHSLFRILWLTTVASQIATWMQNAAAGWQMTLLTDAALPVALLQTATSLPFLLVGLPSGALADKVERRHVLIATHMWLAACAGTLTLLSATGNVEPWLLLALTLSVGLGTAMNNPALLAALMDAVPPADLAGATTLSSAAINAARAAGPPVAGVLIALADPAAAYAVVTLAFLTVAITATRLPFPAANRTPATDPTERVSFRWLIRLRTFRVVLARTALFIGGASALWSLLPLIAARHLDLGPEGFGLLVGLLGTGALIGAAIVSPLRARMSTGAMTTAGTALFAAAIAALAATTNAVAGAGLMLLLGVAWLATRSTLTVAAQLTVPSSVRGRAFAAQLMVWNGGQAAGAVVWALVAHTLGLGGALAVSGVVLGAGIPLGARRLPLPRDETAAAQASVRTPG
jgi:predicted MFS family arabinose efflux permease